jgi:hypothetical protein
VHGESTLVDTLRKKIRLRLGKMNGEKELASAKSRTELQTLSATN